MIVDVDNDNHAEIVLIANNYAFSGITGIRVFENADDNWMPTRQIWNQHAYHIDNINDNGSVPQLESPSWLSHNTYRLNTFPDRNPLDSPDLSTAQLVLLDNGFAQLPSLRVLIGNGGLITPIQTVEISFYQGDPDASGILLGTTTAPALAEGVFTTIQLDGVTLANDDALYAVVDPAEQINECDESNNQVSIPVSSAALQGTISVNTDAPSYPANSPVALQATLANTGSFSGDFTATLQIEDPNGAIVASFAAQTVPALAAGASQALSDSWNTGATLAGNYLLRGLLYDNNGTLLDQDTSPFAITTGVNADLTGTITTDKTVYAAWDTVALQSRVRNLTVNAIQGPSIAEVSVLDPNGAELLRNTHNLPELTPGALRDLPDTLNLVDAPAGSYRARLAVKDAVSLALLASDETSFDVLRHSSQGISGTVTVDIPELYPGEINHCREVLSNHAASAVNALTAYHRLVSLASGEVLQGPRSWTTSLPAQGDSAEHVEPIDTALLEPGDYACVLSIDDADGGERTLANAVFRVLEAPIDLDLTLRQSGGGRVLVLLDEPKRQCHGVEYLDLETHWTSALSDAASVEVEIFDGRGALLDDESAPVNSQAVDANPGARVNLKLLDISPQHLALSVWATGANGLLGESLLVEATLRDGARVTTLTSTLMPTDGKPELSLGESWGDFTVTELRLRLGGKDPHRPKHNPDLSTQQAYLETLLSEAGWSYTITTTAKAFARELRSGAYATYLLLSGQNKLGKQLQRELSEAVYRGEGLIQAGGKAKHKSGKHKGKGKGKPRDYLNPALGIVLHNKLNRIDAVELLSSEVHPGGFSSFAVVGKPLRVALAGAESTGRFVDDRGVITPEIAVTRADYGQGRSIYIGFDLLAEASFDGALDNLYATLLLGALEYVYPADQALQPGGVYPLTATLTNLGIATPGRLTLALPSGVEMIDANGATRVPGSDPEYWQWLFDLDEAEVQRYGAWIKLSEGVHHLVASADSGIEPDWVAQAQRSLELATDIEPDLGTTLIDVQALGKTYQHVAKYLERADDALAAGEFKRALNELVRASKAVADIGTAEADAWRLNIAWLIRAVGPQLTLAP